MSQFKCPECKFINFTKEKDKGTLIVCKQCGHVFDGQKK